MNIRPPLKRPGAITKAGVALDTWKLPIFERHLERAHFVFKNDGELTKGVTHLTVFTTSILALQPIVTAASKECLTSDLRPK